MDDFLRFLAEHSWLWYFIVGAGIVFGILLFRAAWRGQEIAIGPVKIGARVKQEPPPETPLQQPRETGISSLTQDRFMEQNWLDGPLSITRSIVCHDGKKNVRNPDSQVVTDIRKQISGKIIFEDPCFSIENPASHLLVTGCPRYNPHATLIQKTFHLPYQYVVSQHDDKPENSIIKIVTTYGEELTSSRDKGIILGSEGVDYGILFLGKIRNQKNILWISGVHGAGTLGVCEYYKRNWQKIYDLSPSKEGTGTTWLIRIRYERRTLDADDEIRSVECLGDPLQCEERRLSPDRWAIVSDFGNVLMYFDRTRTYRGLAHTCGIPYQHVVDQIENSTIRQRYELGLIDDMQFMQELACLIGNTDDCLNANLISEAWGDIFCPNKEMIRAFTNLRRDNVPIILLSNTNPIHFQYVLKYYPEIKATFDEAVLSYESNKAKPNQEIFEKAMKAVTSKRPDLRPADIIYIDDKLEYVERAKLLGMEGFVYRSYPQFAFWLRKRGLYID